MAAAVVALVTDSFIYMYTATTIIISYEVRASQPAQASERVGSLIPASQQG